MHPLEPRKAILAVTVGGFTERSWEAFPRCCWGRRSRGGSKCPLVGTWTAPGMLGEQPVACWAHGECVPYTGPVPSEISLCLPAGLGRDTPGPALGSGNWELPLRRRKTFSVVKHLPRDVFSSSHLLFHLPFLSPPPDLTFWGQGPRLLGCWPGCGCLCGHRGTLSCSHPCSRLNSLKHKIRGW